MIGPANATRLRIVRMRRDYNRWVANQTLEDYALRFTAKSARIWSPLRVANTALGSISFLALEAIGGTLTLSYGFANVCIAIVAVALVIFLAGLPVCAAAARYGVDIDLLTRGAGFGYIGATVTSLIYATFTFLFFGIEAAILASMLQRFLLVPTWLAYGICALVIIPLVTHGITFIARLQLFTQPVWLLLNLLPLTGLLITHPAWLHGWAGYRGLAAAPVSLGAVGACASIMAVLISQTAEQVDFIRFMPPRRHASDLAWWSAVILGGPAWVLFDAVKLLAGSLLAWVGLQAGLAAADAVQPAQMYRLAYETFLPPLPALAATVLLVGLSQVKINVTNAYAGSLAWSNFFSRLTHSHPGRVFYVVFNVAIALVLMEAGIVDTIRRGLALYADLATAWMGAVVGDLVISKPAGWSPRGIEFKRAHLPDINPVGVGAMALGVLAGVASYAGWLGGLAATFGPFLAFGAAFVAAPLIAWSTGGRTYLARRARRGWATRGVMTCSICEHGFEPEDMAFCPAYGGAICSLCCALDSRCGDSCKPASTRLAAQLAAPFARPLALLPVRARRLLESRLGRFAALLLLCAGALWLLLSWASHSALPAALLVAAILSWLVVLSTESRRDAEEETSRQTRLLLDEISAHSRTDAALHRSRDKAEAASQAKSRYVVGISHELRSPLNAILGYAQLMEGDPTLPEERRRAVRIIRESGEHLSAIIAGLLDISRIEAGRIELYRDRVQLPALVESLAQMMRPQAQEKGLRLLCETHGLPPVVHADEHRLRQILTNLLSNAIKFTDAGEVRFTASWRSQIAEFVVSDTGRGIRAADLERIFEPFERADVTDIPGTGLGLTITRLLTEILGGEVRVSSAVGQGSQFTVVLMLADVPGGEALPPVERIRGHDGGRRRILVVDDDAAHRALMDDLLTPLGFDLRSAPDAAACLTLAPGFAPDLFLLDLSMPGSDGRALAVRLRETGFAATPILFISGHAHVQALKSDPALSGCAVLAKPVDLAALLHEIGLRLGLTWRQAAQDGGTSLSMAQIEAIRALADRGQMRALREHLDALERAAPELVASLHRLRALLAAYRLDEVQAELDSMANLTVLP